MTTTELDSYRRQLLSLRDRLQGDVNHLASEALPDEDQGGGNLSKMPIHMADLGTDAFEQENTLHLLSREENLLEEINAALARLDAGTFGRCERCQKPISPKGRLKEIPYTRYCVGCATQLDAKR